MDKIEAIQSMETATWAKAEKNKHSAVKRVREEAALKIAKELEHQRKKHEQKLKVRVLIKSKS